MIGRATFNLKKMNFIFVLFATAAHAFTAANSFNTNPLNWKYVENTNITTGDTTGDRNEM